MRIKTALMCGVCALISGAALAQDEFICHGLDRPACIPEYHKVAPERDVCFDQYTCDFKGFVCKSAHTFRRVLRVRKLMRELFIIQIRLTGIA